jgi:hypothetical protein
MPLIFGLLQFIPEIAHLFGNSTINSAVDSPIAQKVLSIAQVVTGAATPDAAIATIQGDPATALAFKKAVLDQQVTLEQLAMQKAKNDDDADIADEVAVTDRAARLEGTAGDLKAIPYLGPILLVLRGAQRPIIGYGVMYVDYMTFSGIWKLPDGPILNAWFATNILVLAFLFGERAIRNVAPLLTDLLAAKAKL